MEWCEVFQMTGLGNKDMGYNVTSVPDELYSYRGVTSARLDGDMRACQIAPSDQSPGSLCPPIYLEEQLIQLVSISSNWEDNPVCKAASLCTKEISFHSGKFRGPK